MRRFSIFHAMGLIALVAVNCAAIRAVLRTNGGWVGFGTVFIGLLPLLDAQIIALYLFASWYRIELRRRGRRERVGLTPAFAATIALGLAGMLTAGGMAPDGVMAYLEYVLAPVDVFFRSMGFQKILYESSMFRSFAIPLLVGAALSGPPLLLALVVAWLSSEYTFIIAARHGPAVPSVAAAADPGETDSHEDTA